VGASDEPDDRWAHWLRHLLWEVSARTALLGEAALGGTPLTLPSIGVLDQIAAQPGITIAEIARRGPTSQQAISQLVARLERLGFVERRLAAGRGVALHVTPDGARAKAQGNAIEEALEARLEEALGRDRYARLRALLEETRAVVMELDSE
jgi:DNA-binding MarR family transcriptional regulator